MTHARGEGFRAKWGACVQGVKRELYALWRASGDPRVPWYAKAVGAVVLAYALSPIDLIPDFIPVLGYLDDALLIPLGLLLFRRLVPPEVLVEARAAAEAEERPPSSAVGAALVVASWLVAVGAIVWRGLAT